MAGLDRGLRGGTPDGVRRAGARGHGPREAARPRGRRVDGDRARRGPGVRVGIAAARRPHRRAARRQRRAERREPADPGAEDERLGVGSRGSAAGPEVAGVRRPRVHAPDHGRGSADRRVTDPPVTGRDALLARAIGHFAGHGAGDPSLRAPAAALGTTHRMLIYHFGSRDGLLAAVVDTAELGARETLARMVEEALTDRDPLEAGLRYWHLVTEDALIYGPL